MLTKEQRQESMRKAWLVRNTNRLKIYDPMVCKGRCWREHFQIQWWEIVDLCKLLNGTAEWYMGYRLGNNIRVSTDAELFKLFKQRYKQHHYKELEMSPNTFFKFCVEFRKYTKDVFMGRIDPKAEVEKIKIHNEKKKKMKSRHLHYPKYKIY